MRICTLEHDFQSLYKQLLFIPTSLYILRNAFHQSLWLDISSHIRNC